GAEGWAERVYLAQTQTISFDIELAGNGEKRFLTEEILVPVDLAFVVTRQVGQVERGDAKHLARAFGVGCGDDRRVDPEKSALVEIAVNGLGDAVAHARDRTERVRARAQVRDLAQVLHRVRLGLDRIGFRILDPADDFHFRRLNLETLA